MKDKYILRLAFATTVALGLLAAGCSSWRGGRSTPIASPGGPTALATTQVRYLDQGWSEKVRDRFHYTSQGSELIPYDWFFALENPNSASLFKDDLKRYGFLFEPASSDPLRLDPESLPLGFARHEESLELNGLKEARWIGLTCAACHTGAITYKAKPTDTTDTTLIIDGAPSSADFGAFLKDLGDAVQATNADPQKRKAFAERVVRAGHESSAADVETRFKRFAAQFSKIVQCAATTHAWGPGRADAFGVIFNRVCDVDLPDTTDKIAPPDAPVSYPFLWYSSRQDHVQWHGEVDNHDWLHRLGRNTGEVIGVFSRVDMKPGKLSYPSSVDPKGLGALDGYVGTLKHPAWPTDVFGALDVQKVARGKKLFYDKCGSCHKDLPASGLVRIVPTPLSEVNTDDVMTTMVHTRSSPTAGLAGKQKFILVGGKFGSSAPAAEILGTVGAGTLLGKKPAVLEAFIGHWLDSRYPNGNVTPTAAANAKAVAKTQATATVTDSTIATAYQATAPGVDRSKIGYEARPLAGIWATAPYLHNGSVPNLAQLLRLDKREARFYVGSLAFDPMKVGFVSGGSRGGVVFDTTLPGNSNGGHEYGTNLSPDEKQDLIEYLKSR